MESNSLIIVQIEKRRISNKFNIEATLWIILLYGLFQINQARKMKVKLEVANKG